MKKDNILKILTILIFVVFFGLNINTVEAKKHDNGPTFSKSGCGNFNLNGHHYGGSERCAVLGIDCPSNGGGCSGGGCGPGPGPDNHFDPCAGVSSCACGTACCPASGSCSAINGKVVSKNPGVQGCSAYPGGIDGPALSTGGDKYTWRCLESCGGVTASCSAYAMPQVGKCGDSFVSGSTALVDTLPENSILCKRGTAINVASSTTAFTWNCEGSGGAVDSGICTAQKVGKDQVATVFSTSTPVKTLTVTGRITPNIVNKGQYCTLSDLEYTTNKGADDSLVACNVYRGSQIYPDKSDSALNYQVEPGYEYIFKCKDYSLTGIGAEGQTQPLKCVLNPTIIEQ